ncbi:MAG TPA: hypothetical protein VL403_06115 [Candidatus Kryptonia bacterium]|nr:hypothetical protein [Candidatus Kryptonia bacterium]
MQIQTLAAARGLALHFGDPHWRVEWGEADWLGPIGLLLRSNDARHLGGGAGFADLVRDAAQLAVSSLNAFVGSDDLGSYCGIDIEWAPMPFACETSVRAYQDLPVIVFRIEAPVSARGVGTGIFEQPSVAWPIFFPTQRLAGGAPAGMRSYGHQYTEFALPVTGDVNCTGFAFAPHRPAVVEPLMLIAPDGRTLMLAPLDQFHEQIISVPRDHEAAHEGVSCGWHGDLAEVPAGFATELAVWAGESPRHVLDAWAGFLRRRHGTPPTSRYADDGVAKLSYWTDNGAVYYYRTEPGRDYLATLERVTASLPAQDVPVRALQIDSWFYPHQNLRGVSGEGAPIVPPSGMMTWEPRGDLFPDGFRELRRRVSNLPLTLHSRHFSSQSPYWQRYGAWTDGEYAHPADSTLFDRLMEQAAGWGAITYEQDWMVESFLGVRGLRERPGRARAWQENLDRAAAEHGLTLQWCMATPADFFQTVTLRRLASVRTSGDYRYLFDNGLNWVWFLHTNALARAFSLTPFKDVFLTHGATAISAGEPYAEIEALLAALSTGPVAIGDEIGRTNRELVMRTCREDGVLIKPDVPLAAIDRCFHANGFLEPAPLIGETHSRHPAGRWSYVASFNACRAKAPLAFRIALADLGALRPDGPALLYNWRERTWTRLDRDGGWDCVLEFQDWDYRVVCPLLPGDVTVFGDVGKYATVGDRRVAHITASARGVKFDVLGAPGTSVEVRGYSAASPSSITAWQPGRPSAIPNDEGSGERWSWGRITGEWIVRVDLGTLSWKHVAIALN